MIELLTIFVFFLLCNAALLGLFLFGLQKWSGKELSFGTEPDDTSITVLSQHVISVPKITRTAEGAKGMSVAHVFLRGSIPATVAVFATFSFSGMETRSEMSYGIRGSFQRAPSAYLVGLVGSSINSKNANLGVVRPQQLQARA